MKQSKLSFNSPTPRRPLGSLDPNVGSSSSVIPEKRPASPGDAEEPTPDIKRPKVTKTASELAQVSRNVAQTTVQRLLDGYRDKSGASYPAAITNAAGCLLAQKTPNRSDNSYVQIAPVVLEASRSANGTKKDKPSPQGAHRLVVRAYGSDDDFEKLLAGWHASHRCHNPVCINWAHITVEPKDWNEGRKDCPRRRSVIVRCVIGGVLYELQPAGECTCKGAKCISMIEEREAVKV